MGQRIGAKAAFITGIVAVLAFASSAFAAVDKNQAQWLADIKNAKTQICLPAIEQLGQSGSPDVINPLSSAYREESRALVRRYLIDALGQLQNIATLPTLKAALRDSDPQVRLSAVAALGPLSDSSVDDALIQAAVENNGTAFKAHLVHHLQFRRDVRTQDALDRLASDKDPEISKKAASARKVWEERRARQEALKRKANKTK